MYNVDLKKEAWAYKFQNYEQTGKGKSCKSSVEKKGIKREFSVARTPNQNRVAKRKNRTLIEAARTMLADSKLPTTFWAEAVNTACYVQNIVLVKETLHITFLENKPNFAGSGPTWILDIDTLTKSMNYKPVVAGNQSNSSVGEKEKKDAEGLENIDSKVPNTEEPRINQEKDANVNNTNNINVVSPTINADDIEDNAVDENIVYGCADDPNMPNLEEIVYSDDDEEVDAEADMTNLDTNIPMDVKSAFSYGRIAEEVYVCQPLRFEDPEFPNRVYKVEKALYGLHKLLEL
nr:ribonuclease H-like domain-containing protein [Tanacetum cinerariifolium]